ncbi:hypothetical protein NW765_017735 [Fusarium oxysporum]|nr:hypothetical protein NW765_017735 [Fusarium oxysporum]
MDHDAIHTLQYNKVVHNNRQHWLRDHIQQGVLFQSWTANNTRRSWLVSTGNDFNSGSIPSSILLQASPDPIKLLAQKLFTEEHARLESQQSGGQRYCSKETPASSALQTNWLRRTGWETTFRDAHRDILVRLAALPHYTANRPLPLGVVEGEEIFSLARDERKLVFMMAALDRLLDQCGETVRKTDVCFWVRLFRLLPTILQKVTGHRLKKHQFKALREL